MSIDLTFYNRCVDTLEEANRLLHEADPTTLTFDMYRSACVKEFEIILEQSGKLLRRVLKNYVHSPKAVDAMYFKELFREAVRRDLITIDTGDRWMEYRENRNNTAHDYGISFAEETLKLIPQFIIDARELSTVFVKHLS